MTHLLRNIYAVELPEGATKVSVTPRGYIQYFEGGHPIYDFLFPIPGSYRLIGVWPGMTEEQAGEVCKRMDGDLAWIPTYNDPDSGGRGYCYDDYMSEDEHAIYYTALESLASLMESKGITGTVAVIEKLNI